MLARLAELVYNGIIVDARASTPRLWFWLQRVYLRTGWWDMPNGVWLMSTCQEPCPELDDGHSNTRRESPDSAIWFGGLRS
jgi:hypothetical protein